MEFFIFIQIFIENSECQQGSHSVSSDLGLHHLPMTHKKDARLLWVKIVPYPEVLPWCSGQTTYLVPMGPRFNPQPLQSL